MLEWWSNGNGYRTLHEDLKIGNNSAWQQGVLAGALNSKMALYKIDDSDPDHPHIFLNEKTKFTRQYYRFVRPGAVRIKSVSQDNAFDSLAFINDNGGYVVVVKCDSGGDFSIGGLVVGTYGIKYTTASQFDVDLPDQTIHFGQPIVTGIPEVGVLTVYTKPMLPDDEAPTAPTQLAVTNLLRSQLTLAWEVSTDNAAVAGYKVYRDGVRIGFSQTNSFEDTRVEPATSYTYRVSAYDTAANESSLSAPLTIRTPEPRADGDLLGYWKFDEGLGTTAIDFSGNGNSGTIIGATWIPITTGYALDFDGVDDCVKIVTDSSLDNLEAITMAVWIYPRVDAHWHVFDKGDGDKRIYVEGMRRTLNGRIRYTGTHAYSESVSNTIVLNRWQHVALTWSRTTNTTRLYHNGIEVQYHIQDIGSGGVLDDATYPFTIGARGALGDVTFFYGLIDEVRLYKRVLSPQEIQDLHSSFSPDPRPRVGS